MMAGSTLLWILLLSVHGYGQTQPSIPQELHGALSVAVKHYNGTSLISEEKFNGNILETGKGRMQLDRKVTAPSKNGRECTLTCKLQRGSAPASALAVSFDFGKWEARNYVMVPGIVYNGNRYRTIGNGYNPQYPRDMYYNQAVPVTLSNNPRLSADKGDASLVELQTNNTAVPAMSFFSPALRKGWIVLTEQQTRWGNSGLTIRENADKDSCSFGISAPAVRRLAAGFGDFHPSGDQAPDWQEGDEVSIRFRMYAFDADNIPALLEKFMTVRKTVTGPNTPRNLLPMSELVAAGTRICSGNFSVQPVGNYYLPENSKDFQLGWVSGMINTFPMLALNDSTERRRVSEELDFITAKMQGGSGFFYGTITANGQVRTEKAPPDFPAVQALVRKNGDVLFWLMKHLMLLKAQGYGRSIKPAWEEAAKRLADAFTRNWKKYGEFGQYIVPETGEIAVFNSSSGAIVPAGLALASAYFKHPGWLQTATAAADFYYTRDILQRGFTGGGCGDISQDADSESCFGFLESLMALYQYTGKQIWLQRAKVQAALCATWTLAYDPVFPATSAIGKLGGKMAGAVWASSQNKHAAPGVCTSSADYLFKLYRATGDKRYAALIRDIQHAHAEAVNMPGHITTNYLTGSSMERIQPSDAEGKGSIGNFIHTRNSWTETDGILMAMEIPGIYLQTDTDQLYVFDHITVTRVSRTMLSLTNKTSYNAEVAVMAETSRMATRPMGYTTFTKWPKVKVKAGETVVMTVSFPAGKGGSPQCKVMK